MNQPFVRGGAPFLLEVDDDDDDESLLLSLSLDESEDDSLILPIVSCMAGN